VEERLACSEFCSIHDGIIRAVIHRLHKNRDDIEDITQEVWVAVIKRLSKLRVDPALGTVTGLVVKIASDLAKKHARLNRRRRSESLSLEAADELPDRGRGPDVEFEWVQCGKELRQLIEAFAASLPMRERQVVLLYWLEEHSLSRVAADMMISEDSVWGIIRRVCPDLVAFLQRKGYGAF
jgi:RNA polymerase sigma factor (sigma-70 family)